MREYAGRVTDAPRQADRHGKPGNVLGRVHVRVQPCSARAGEAMPLPLSDGPTNAARLACVGGVDVDYQKPSGFGLVVYEVLQLSEGPAVQPGPNTLPGLYAGPDVGQVFHTDLAGACAQGFGYYGFAGFVVDVLYVPFLAPGDSLEFALGCAAAVGLEASAARCTAWHAICEPSVGIASLTG